MPHTPFFDLSIKVVAQWDVDIDNGGCFATDNGIALVKVLPVVFTLHAYLIFFVSSY